MLKTVLLTTLAAVLGLAAPPLAQPAPSGWAPGGGERIFDLALGDGVSQRVLYDAPPRSRATLADRK